MFQEQVLYNLWKVCNGWLDLKSQKSVEGASVLFVTRKAAVETLRDEALAELEAVSPKFRAYQEQKQKGPLGFALKGLAQGYDLERAHYLASGKKAGSSISGSMVHQKLNEPDSSKNAKFKKLVKKGFGNLSLQDSQALQRLFPDAVPVIYLNKIARLKYLVTIKDGKICDSNGDPIVMRDMSVIRVAGSPVSIRSIAMYAMDKYGNLYVDDKYYTSKQYIGQENGKYVVKQSYQNNHSSLLAGTDVLCAGCLHIGWDNRRQGESGGALSAIDSSSGHYKPTRENLRNCLQVFQSLGVNVDMTRVGDCSAGPQPLFYWGQDFLADRNPWPSWNTPVNSGLGFLGAGRLKAPHIKPDADA